MPYAAFRRQPVPQQYAQALRTTTFPAPTRGIILNENESYMQPGGALVQDNWMSTMQGVKLRGGFTRWCDLHALDTTVPPVPDAARAPVISAFEYVSGSQARMYAAQATKLFEITTSTPVLIKGGQNSGNYATAQMSNAAGNWLIAVNDFGDPPLRFNGASWVTLTGSGTPSDGASQITGPAGTPVALGGNLTYVWKYRNRLFFIEHLSMNAYFLDLDSVGGLLQAIPLSGAASRGGYLLFGAVYSTDAGDGLDDKCVMVTNLGEILVFSGTNPADPANWRQEGRWAISPPLGMNAHIQIGGDLIVLTVDGIVPISQALIRDVSQLELAMLTRTIKPIWRDNVFTRRGLPWTVKKWDELGQLFVTWPGGNPGDRMCAVSNLVTGAWSRFVGYDAMCFARMREDMFFGTQDGIIMQAERSGSDDGRPYVATLIGGWEMFGAPAALFVWHQARANFHASASEGFQPQITACTDYVLSLPPAPPTGLDAGGELSVWDQGLWAPTPPPPQPPAAPTPDYLHYARWDQPSAPVIAAVRNTGWISIGETGYAHAPVIQVTIGQQAPPVIEMISVGATYEPAGVNV